MQEEPEYLEVTNLSESEAYELFKTYCNDMDKKTMLISIGSTNAPLILTPYEVTNPNELDSKNQPLKSTPSESTLLNLFNNWKDND